MLVRALRFVHIYYKMLIDTLTDSHSVHTYACLLTRSRSSHCSIEIVVFTMVIVTTLTLRVFHCNRIYVHVYECLVESLFCFDLFLLLLFLLIFIFIYSFSFHLILCIVWCAMQYTENRIYMYVLCMYSSIARGTTLTWFAVR